MPASPTAPNTSTGPDTGPGSSLNRRQCLCLAATALGAPQAATATSSSDTKAFFDALRQGGCVVLMRHALTEPGIGDPPGFSLGRCATQRNLSEQGRQQARRVGEAFAREGIALAAVRSSAWCRCTDTARQAFGRYTEWAALNSFFQDQGNADAQTREVLNAVASLRAPQNWMLVTHQVNISALTGEFPAMGELFLTRPSASSGEHLRVVGRWGGLRAALSVGTESICEPLQPSVSITEMGCAECGSRPVRPKTYRSPLQSVLG